jgi:hypothetical protein
MDGQDRLSPAMRCDVIGRWLTGLKDAAVRLIFALFPPPRSAPQSNQQRRATTRKAPQADMGNFHRLKQGPGRRGAKKQVFAYLPALPACLPAGWAVD